MRILKVSLCDLLCPSRSDYPPSVGSVDDAMDVDRQETPPEEQVNMANAVDLSESEEEEELEDIIDDFANIQQEQVEVCWLIISMVT